MIRSRRKLLAGAVAAVGIGVVPAGFGGRSAVLPTSPLNLSFDVFHDDRRIGFHEVSMTRTGDEMLVRTRVAAVVKMFVLAAFEYRHRSDETWDETGLLSLDSEIEQQGQVFKVRGRRIPGSFRVVGPSGPYLAPVDALTTNSLWTSAFVRQQTLIDVKRGGVVGVDVQSRGQDTIQVSGESRRTDRYRVITPYLAGSIWYDAREEWVRATLEQNGSIIEFRRA